MLIPQAPGEKLHFRLLFLCKSRWRKSALPLEINYILRLVLTIRHPGGPARKLFAVRARRISVQRL